MEQLQHYQKSTIASQRSEQPSSPGWNGHPVEPLGQRGHVRNCSQSKLRLLLEWNKALENIYSEGLRHLGSENIHFELKLGIMGVAYTSSGPGMGGGNDNDGPSIEGTSTQKVSEQQLNYRK